MENRKIQELLTDKDLEELFAVKRATLADYRRDGLPYLKISGTRRLYLESDVMDWLISRRVKATEQN